MPPQRAGGKDKLQPGLQYALSLANASPTLAIMENLVSTQWLADNLGAADLAIIDASSHLPDAGRDAKAEFETAHIPGAVFLDLASFFDPDSAVPGAIPTAEQFARRMSELGVASGMRVVIYDDSFIKTSARAWFIFHLHGVKELAILDGGLGKWRAEGRPLESGTPTVAAADHAPGKHSVQVRTKADVLANLDSCREQVVDGRGPGHFTGEQPDFRPEVASGHIPGARNVVFATVLNEDGTYKDEAGIRAAFEACGVDLDKPIITSCGGGVVAAVLYFALHRIGKGDVALYDGSWTEWGSDPATPKELGEAR